MFRLIVLVVALTIFIPAHALAQADEGAEGPPEGEFGNWPFPGSVDELPDGMRPGQAYTGFPNNYRKNVDWMSIPSWLAGDWASKDLRIMKTYDHTNGTLKTIPSSTVAPFADHFGDQTDRQGTVWSCNFTPYITNLPLDQLTDSQLTIGMKPLEVREDGVALWQRVLHVLLTPNNAIHDSYTEERVTEFSPQGPGMTMAQITARFYNPAGDPIFTTNSMRIMRKVKQYQPLQQRNGINLPMSLSEYLQSTGRPELMFGNQ
ncbi:hypothetical protein KF707_16050 [Candidatus Obscuribacterales bacterium]|nr:hypothetical protein [Candidatus Obscuribacterales bacterium]